MKMIRVTSKEFVHELLVVSILLLGIFGVLASGGGGSNDDSDTTTNLTTVALAPLYANNGAAWNSYVKNDGVTIFEATDAACDGSESGGYSACIHGGEYRVVVLNDLTDCTGITASDALSAFNWTCDDGSGSVRVISTGLQSRKYLSDLIDFTARTWRVNTLTISKDGAPTHAVAPSVWWGNPVTVVPQLSGNILGLTNAGWIYLVTATTDTSYTLDGHSIALLIDPDAGVVLLGAGIGTPVVASGGYRFLWIEGAIDGTDDSDGISLNNTNFSVLKNLHVRDANTGNGVSLSFSNRNALSDILTTGNGSHGLVLHSASENTVNGIHASNNLNVGVTLNFNSNDNIVTNVMSSNNHNYNFQIVGAHNNVVNNFTAINGINHGVSVDTSHNNTIRSVSSVNNGAYGFALFNPPGSAQMGGSSDNTVSGIAIANSRFGLFIDDGANNNVVSDVASAHQNDTGIFVRSSAGNTFSGLVTVGSNNVTDCKENNSIVACSTLVGISPTLTQGVSLAVSVVGKATTEDATNTSDVLGVGNFDIITDWTGFDNAYRGWGKDEGAFPDPNQQDACSAGENCRIWDFSLDVADTNLREVLSIPSGADTLNHTSSDTTQTTHLAHAWEIAGDTIGNDNGLCESGETCLYTPNIGSYQGHGNLISAGNFVDGMLTGITLMRYEFNGR